MSYKHIILAAWALSCGLASAQLKIVTTQPDLADLAHRIGGEQVEVYSLTEGTEDLHLVGTRPSMLVRLSRAELFIELGLDAEHAWLPPLLARASNSAIKPGGIGFLNASGAIIPIKSTAGTTRGQGPDIHPLGNPHYNLDPERMRLVARAIHRRLTDLVPDHKSDFDEGLKVFERQLDERMDLWRKQLGGRKGAGFIEHHDAWAYFAERFELRIVGRLEPAPGSAPTPSHLSKIIRVGKQESARLVVGRPASADVAEKVAAAIGGEAAILTLSSTKSSKGGYLEWMDLVVKTFAAGLGKP